MKKNLILKTSINTNATAVSLSPRITISFVESINPESINNNSVYIQKLNGAIVESKLDYNLANKLLTVEPSLLDSKSWYSLTIKSGSDGVISVFENEMASTKIIQFETEEKIVKEGPEVEPNPEDEETPTESENGKEEEKEIPVDEPTTQTTQSLRLVKSYPEENSVVESLSKMALIFSESMTIYDGIEKDLCLIDANTDPIIAELLGMKQVGLSIEVSEIKDTSLILTPIEALVAGNEYKLFLYGSLKSANGSFLKSSRTITFTNRWNFYYSSVSSVRAILGNFSDDFEDERIARMIAEVSSQVRAQFSKSSNFVEEEWENDKVAYYVIEYVKFKVAYLLILNLVVKQNVSQSESIKLGDLSIEEKSASSSEIADLLGLLKGELDDWANAIEEEEAKVNFAGMSSVVRATSNEKGATYPDYFTRVPFKELGS